MNTKPRDPATADALRHEIDSGSGRDKVPYPDPAAAPLGTDDEAAGTPVTPDQVRQAAAHELRGPGGSATAAPGVVHDRQATGHDSDRTLQTDPGRPTLPRRATPQQTFGVAALAVLVVMLLLMFWMW